MFPNKARLSYPPEHTACLSSPSGLSPLVFSTSTTSEYTALLGALSTANPHLRYRATPSPSLWSSCTPGLFTHLTRKEKSPLWRLAPHASHCCRVQYSHPPATPSLPLLLFLRLPSPSFIFSPYLLAMTLILSLTLSFLCSC